MSWIALKMLVGDRAKFFGIVMGLTFAALLITQQGSIFCGLMHRTAGQIKDISGADLWVAARGNDNFDFASPMDERLYYRVAETPGVARAERMILAFGQFRLPTGGTQGVGRSTTQAVVTSSVLILVVDFFVTKLIFALLGYR